MDRARNSSRPSGIPRPSKLPVPKSSVRHRRSKEALQPLSIDTLSNPRQRSSLTRSVSREQLQIASKLRPAPATSLKHQRSAIFTQNRDVSTGTVIHTPAATRSPRRASQDLFMQSPFKSALPDDQYVEDENTLAVEESTMEGYDVPTSGRPSLSQRTMETLHNIPSSPAVRKRNSSFFNSDSGSRPSTRDSTSRPNSSSGLGKAAPGNFSAGSSRASTNTYKMPRSTQPSTPLQHPSIINSLKTPSAVHTVAPATTTKNLSAALGRKGSPALPRVPSTLKSGSKSVATRPLKPRASVQGLFRKSSVSVLSQSTESDTNIFLKAKAPTFSPTPSGNSSEETSTSMASKGSRTTSISSVSANELDAPRKSSVSANELDAPRKSSTALRDQIAKAKAAKRAASAKLASPKLNGSDFVIASGSFDFGLAHDPFNQQIDPNNNKVLLRKRIQTARTDGKLNIAAMGFTAIPDEVLNMYNLENIGEHHSSWAESVDLTRLIAADNEFETLSPEVFPDIDPREAMQDDDAKGNHFGGLETMDFRGNKLSTLPLGLRRLEFLTTLVLSNNKLSNDCLQVISQISSLRDLKIGGNDLTGQLDASITRLRNLQVLDLRQNQLTVLPDGLVDLVRLRMLNVTENQLMSLPFDALSKLPLTELLAAKNKLSGTLIAENVGLLPHLQILDVTSNALTSLHESGNLCLPALHQLSCSSNRLVSLPEMSTWSSLLTIAAENNSIEVLPQGFVALPKVKNVNFTGNNLRTLDDAIGAMDTLDVLRISGNPLRDKKFAGMSTEDLKRCLKARILPIEAEVDKDNDTEQVFFSAPESPPPSPQPTSSDWVVNVGGVLDRSNTKSHSLNPVAAADTAANYKIKTLELHHNNFKIIPDSIAFFASTLTSLSLAHNELNSDTFMKDDLELPALQGLNLSSNTLNSLQPLFNHLQAPNLLRLDVSFNRLSSLPTVRSHFPNLTTLLASHNTINELTPESIQGLQVVDCSSNDLNSLNAHIGLLGGPGGLQMLDVRGNRFRVPKYTVLERGTEATLAWLRDKIPTSELGGSDCEQDD